MYIYHEKFNINIHIVTDSPMHSIIYFCTRYSIYLYTASLFPSHDKSLPITSISLIPTYSFTDSFTTLYVYWLAKIFFCSILSTTTLYQFLFILIDQKCHYWPSPCHIGNSFPVLF